MKREAGYSLVELLVAASVTILVTTAIFRLVDPSYGAFSAQGEEGDMQQRLRVAADTLSADLVMAGAGSYSGAGAGTLAFHLAPVMPYRRGAIRDDEAGTYRSDTITLLHVPSTAAQATIAADVGPSSSVFTIAAGAGCPVGQPACGFEEGDTVLVYDGTGAFDTFVLTSVGSAGGTWLVSRPSGVAAATYHTGATIVKAVQRTYALKTDPASRVPRLVLYDGTASADTPVVDHLVDLHFEYFGDPQPPRLTKPAIDPVGPWTTYGPRPPAATVQSTAYPPGENCVFTLDVPTGQHLPRLEVLGDDAAGTTPIALTAAQLTDGPWCPDAFSAGAFDADLLRIRNVAVTLRIEAASDALRGPAGVLFRRGGTSARGTKWLPDHEARFSISPRNLNLGHEP